jgi:TniQ
MVNSVSISHGELLVLRPKPKPDESLSSWIDRLSSGFGHSLNEFSKLVLHSQPLGRVDVDRNCPHDILQTLAEITGTPLERVEASSIIDKTLASEARAWVLYPPPHGGFQYCPECLSDLGIFRRSWRFLFSVGCAVHGKLLIDQCPHCKRPIRVPYGDRVGIFSRFMCIR